MKKLLALLALPALLSTGPAAAQQSILQSGSWTAGHLPIYSLTSYPYSQPILVDSGLPLTNILGLSNTFFGALDQFGAGTGSPTHLATGQSTAPVLSSCGTSPTISGTDTAGLVTMGTGTPTGCTITFNVAYTATPYCIVSWLASPLVSQSYAVSITALTLTQTGTSNNKATYICIGQNGG